MRQGASSSLTITYGALRINRIRSGAIIAVLAAVPLPSQSLTHQGFLESRGWFYPKTTPGDSGAYVADLRIRWDGGLRISEQWAASFGAEGYADTHRQARRNADLFWFDNSVLRPALSVRQLSIRYLRGDWRFEAGKQFIRWGQTEFFSPTDRFAPRDYVDPLESETLGVTAFRAVYNRAAGTLDAVFAPRFTPSRLPVPTKRWMQIPTEQSGRWRFRDVGTEYPGGTQWGVRYHHAGHSMEWSLSWFDGYLHTPNVSLLLNPFKYDVKFLRRHPRTRMVGADLLLPLRAWTLRGESGYFRSSSPYADDFLQFVAEAEWIGEKWVFLAAYSGESVLEARVLKRFSPDRLFARVATARVRYRPSARHEFTMEGLSRDDASGWGMRASYARTFGVYWRLTFTGTYLEGDSTTVVGRYSDNSGISLRLRYSF